MVTKYRFNKMNCELMLTYDTPAFGKQEVGIWRVQKRYLQYGILIWCLWPNIRFLPSTVTEKNATKNIFDGQTDRGKTVYPPPPSGSGGIINMKMHCKGNFKLRSHNSDWCSIEVATKAGLIVEADVPYNHSHHPPHKKIMGHYWFWSHVNRNKMERLVLW